MPCSRRRAVQRGGPAQASLRQANTPAVELVGALSVLLTAAEVPGNDITAAYFITYFILLLIITFGQPRPRVVVGAILSRNAKLRSLRYDGGAVIGSRLISDATLEVFLLLWQVPRCLIMYQEGPMW